MAVTREGRGAWPKKGYGGTLAPSSQGTVPGPFYMLATDDIDQVGLAGWCKRTQGIPIGIDYVATYHGVVGIQMLTAAHGNITHGDGIFGPDTKRAVEETQRKLGISVDGIVGKQTMEAMLKPVIQNRSAKANISWEAPYGILRWEGGWDPGAVGYIDKEDLGLAQINLPSHPEVSVSQAFCPSFAVDFVMNYLNYGMKELNGNLIDAVISYNLGVGGTRQWIDAGRPETWTPAWSTFEREPLEYAERILNAHKL